MTAYAKYFDSYNKHINFFIKDKKLLKTYNAIWKKVSRLMKKGFDSEPVYNNWYIKAKIKLHNGIINTNFEGNKIPEEIVHCVCLSVILLDHVVKMNKKKFCKYF